MELATKKVSVHGVPAYVKSWAAAFVPDLVYSALMRWEREFEKLPDTFYMLICPQVEINARGGLPPHIHEYIDPKLTCRQFTGCHKPYFIAMFTKNDSKNLCLETQQLLAWCESYQVHMYDDGITLEFLDCTEELENEADIENSDKNMTFQELIASGKLMRILE